MPVVGFAAVAAFGAAALRIIALAESKGSRFRKMERLVP